MAKVSVAGVCKDELERTGIQMTLVELHAACVKAGLDVAVAQVYAGVQSMASTGKCDRGTEKQTWIKLGSGRAAGEGKVHEPGEPKPVRTKLGNKTQYLPMDVINELTAVLGEPQMKPADGHAHCFVLDGSENAEFILGRTRIVLEREPTAWFLYNIGESYAVGFQL